MKNTIVFGRTKLKTVFYAMKLMGFGPEPILVSIVLKAWFMRHILFLPHIHIRLKKLEFGHKIR